MTAQQTLSDYVQRYLRLSSHYGPGSGKANEVFGKLRDLLIVEIYFMKTIRFIVHEEELSGFVLYVENGLRDIVDSFTTDVSQFPAYFKHVMEFRAFSYLRENRRKALTETAYGKTFLLCSEEVAEKSPEDFYMENEEKQEIRRHQKKLADKLRFVCACQPSRRRNLFIYICTLLPYLPSDTIDDFCTVLNCDRTQTFAIADYLCSLQHDYDIGRSSRAYYKSRVDHIRMRIMELEYTLDCSDRQDEKLREEIGRFRMMLSNTETGRPKMNVEYPVIGEVLNLEPTAVATAVHASKKILSMLLGEIAGDGYISRQIKGHSYSRPPRLNRLEPFKAFGITVIKPHPRSRTSKT